MGTKKYADVVTKSNPTDVVMTPPHIAQLMAKLANPQPDSVIFDPTCGDGNLLAACPQGQLVGVEQEPHLFSICQDRLPEAYLYCGDSFLYRDRICSHKPTIVLTNPPYSRCEEEKVSLANRFIDFGLSCLQPGGILIALVPISCGTSQHSYTDRLMKAHTLKAVMTLPKRLFGNEAKVETILMVWKAHTPHNLDQPVWFASWQDDGITCRKESQVAIPTQWASREQSWLEMYRQKQVIPGESLLQCVGPSDEWCFEAYLETDYTKLEPRLFFEALVNNLAYSVRGNPEVFRGVQVANEMPLVPDSWGAFDITDLFKIRGGNYKEPLKNLYVEPNTGLSPVTSASVFNNGVARYTQEPPPFLGHRITMARKTNYSGYAFYQQVAFHATPGANILTPTFRVTPLASLFLTVVISQISPQYSYIRAVSLKCLEQMSIRLPATATGQPDCQYMDTYMRRLRIRKSR